MLQLKSIGSNPILVTRIGVHFILALVRFKISFMKIKDLLKTGIPTVSMIPMLPIYLAITELIVFVLILAMN